MSIGKTQNVCLENSTQSDVVCSDSCSRNAKSSQKLAWYSFPIEGNKQSHKLQNRQYFTLLNHEEKNVSDYFVKYGQLHHYKMVLCNFVYMQGGNGAAALPRKFSEPYLFTSVV